MEFKIAKIYTKERTKILILSHVSFINYAISSTKLWSFKISIAKVTVMITTIELSPKYGVD